MTANQTHTRQYLRPATVRPRPPTTPERQREPTQLTDDCRIRKTKTPLPPSITKETQPRFNQITTLFTSLIPDLTPPTNPWRYQRQISPGIQEFIEALAFQHYLETQTLITLDEVRAWLPVEIGRVVSEEDYLLGLFDFTGEVMRFAVTSLGVSVDHEHGQEQEQGQGQGQERMLPSSQADIVVDLRAMRASLEMLSVPRRHSHAMIRDMGKKVEVMQNSVEKVERAAYGILVRGSERPAGWMPELQVEAT